MTIVFDSRNNHSQTTNGMILHCITLQIFTMVKRAPMCDYPSNPRSPLVDSLYRPIARPHDLWLARLGSIIGGSIIADGTKFLIGAFYHEHRDAGCRRAKGEGEIVV
jgi:hypothetical protein